MNDETVIDFDRYPLGTRDGAAYWELVNEVRRQIAADGCAILPGFVAPKNIGTLVAEAERVAPAAHRSFNRTNAYFSGDDPTLSLDHPRRRFYDRSNAFVPADNFGSDSQLRAIYEAPSFAPFIQDCLEEEGFYRYADPLADVIINLVEPGGGFPWHFDTNNYTVTLAIQNAEAGGRFEYVPNLRSAEQENFEAVGAILDGQREGVKSIELRPGDLQIFKGRYALHRVSEVQGNRTRHVAIYSFTDTPGMVGRVERTRQLYGRVLPIHHEREAAARSDTLLD